MITVSDCFADTHPKLLYCYFDNNRKAERYDILGWDISGFHSYLCNSLQNELKTVRFNTYGLMDNTFDEVESFSSQIEGKGEPVEWIPVRVGKCD